jgi:hypothetical protein
VGEIVYRGEVHRGEHEPILERDLFDAVQARLAATAVDRKIRLNGSPAILAGRLFDDRGNRMSPSHSSKGGVRYRYYVSQAVLQNRKADCGSITRVPAAEIEALVLDGVHKHLASGGAAPDAVSERDLIERHVERVTVRSDVLQVRLRPPRKPVGHHGPGQDDACRDAARQGDSTNQTTAVSLTLPWTAARMVAIKAIIHRPSATPALTAENRDALLTAIAKARRWIEEMKAGRIGSFSEIAQREDRDERYIRSLATLAFVSPRIVAAIAAGSAPADLTVSGLFKGLPCSWAEQERRIGLPGSA